MADLFDSDAEHKGRLYRKYRKGMESGFDRVGDNHPFVKQYGRKRFPWRGRYFLAPGCWMVFRRDGANWIFDYPTMQLPTGAAR